jgi:type I site-specific restriction endonuclease
MVEALKTTTDEEMLTVLKRMFKKHKPKTLRTDIGSEFAFFRHMYVLNVKSQNVNTCINRIRHGSKLDDDELSTVNNLHTLIEVKANYMYIDGFDNDNINDMMNIITCK